MKRYVYILIVSVLFAIGGIAIFSQDANAATAATCQGFGGGNMESLTTVELSVFCNEPGTMYFGVCDAGNIQDDLFTLTHEGFESINYFDGERERVNVSFANVPGFGFYTFRLESTNNRPPATPAYAISTDLSQVKAFLFDACGSDYTGIGLICHRELDVFVEGFVPDGGGELYLMGRYGELNRLEGARYLTIVADGGAIVDDISATAQGPTYLRLWWQPAGSTDRFLLPSQYWESGGNGGTVDSEFGVSCDGGVPSYHASWENLIPAEEVPLLDINDDGIIEIIPTMTVWAQQTIEAKPTGTPQP